MIPGPGLPQPIIYSVTAVDRDTAAFIDNAAIEASSEEQAVEAGKALFYAGDDDEMVVYATRMQIWQGR